jgi:hypothetical protein
MLIRGINAYKKAIIPTLIIVFAFAVVLLLGILLPFRVDAKQMTDQENFSIHKVGALINNTEMLKNTLAENNTFILSAAEVNGTYRWVNSSGGINPALEMISNKEYKFKIYNPTNEKHDFKLEYKEGNTITTVGANEDIEPGQNTEIIFQLTYHDDLSYYCTYHPELMKGTIKMTEQ